MHKQPPSQDCPVGVNIETVLADVLTEVDSAVEQVLEKITIDDVVQRLKPCVSTSINKKKQYSREAIDLHQMRVGAKGRKAKALRTA